MVGSTSPARCMGATRRHRHVRGDPSVLGLRHDTADLRRGRPGGHLLYLGHRGQTKGRGLHARDAVLQLPRRGHSDGRHRGRPGARIPFLHLGVGAGNRDHRAVDPRRDLDPRAPVFALALPVLGPRPSCHYRRLCAGRHQHAAERAGRASLIGPADAPLHDVELGATPEGGLAGVRGTLRYPHRAELWRERARLGLRVERRRSPNRYGRQTDDPPGGANRRCRRQANTARRGWRNPGAK